MFRASPSRSISPALELGAADPRISGTLDAQARIDQELGELDQTICELQLEDQIRSLPTERNTFSPISRLPPDVLSTIFIYWARWIQYDSMVEQMGGNGSDWSMTDGTESLSDSTESLSDGTESLSDGTESMSDGTESMTDGTESGSEGVEEQMDGVPEWVNASHVCRYWRDVALSCQTLWTYISPASQRWIQEMLSRSKTAPLSIRFEWTRLESKALDILKEIMAHTERIQELRLDLPPDDLERVVPLLSSPAPLLRSLEIHLVTFPGGSSIIPLFDGVTPSLRRLELDQCFIPRPTSVLDNLTTLIVSCFYCRIAPTPPELNLMLSSMPNLEHLELTGSRALARFPRDLATPATDSAQRIQLPRLLRLAIDDGLSQIIRLLSYLDIPSQTEVRMNIQAFSSDSESEWMSFRSLLRQRFFTSEYCPHFHIRSLAVDAALEGMKNFVFSASENACGSRSLDWGCNIPLKIRFSDKNRKKTLDIIQDAYLSGFLASLQSTRVTLKIKRDNCSTFFEDLFGFLPELRYIQLIDTHLIDTRTSLGCLFSFLSLTRHQRDEYDTLGQPSGLMFAPALEELVIRGCKLDRRRRRRDPEEHVGSVTNLYKALAIRKEKGLIPIRLTLIGCRRVSKKDVAKLKDVAAEVTWDGFGDSGT